MSDEILTPKQLMELLDISSPTTLIKYENQGLIIPHRPFGRKKYYLKSEIMNLFKRKGEGMTFFFISESYFCYFNKLIT